MNRPFSFLRKVFLWLLFLYMPVLYGCNGDNPKEAVSAYGEKGQEREIEREQTEEPGNVYSIRYGDWKIKESPVAGTDNLYELMIPELTDKNSWISIIGAYENELLVLVEKEENDIKLCLLDPLDVRITAETRLAEGGYTAEHVKVSGDGQIEVYNQYKNVFYIFDGELKETEQIQLEDVQSDWLVLSGNHEFVYYMDTQDNCVYRYETKTHRRNRIAEKKENQIFGTVTGLLNRDTCLAYSYYLEDAGETFYEIINLSTKEQLYRELTAITNITSLEDSYLLYHYEEGLNEILYGEWGEKTPYVLSLSEYGEYDSVKADLQNRSVISSVLKEGAEADYTISFRYYSLDTGRQEHTVNVHHAGNSDGYVSGGEGVYVPAADCVVCFIDGSDKRFLVWDVTTDSSRTGDDTDYRYLWQNPNRPDLQKLRDLKERAGIIGRENGVDIHLGEEIAQCPRDIYDYKVSNNVVRIEKMLTLLEKALGKYPKGMLAQLEEMGKRYDYGSRLQIYLCGGIFPIDETGINSIGIQNTIDGVTFLVLDINSFQDLENTIYHEIFHAIESNINFNEDAFFDYEVWDALNPEEFSYDYDYQVNETNYDYSYVEGEEGEAVYFLDVYSKSFPHEDRARIMEYAMLDESDTRRERKMIKAPGIQAKLSYISERIRKGFDTTGWPEKTVWEKALEE